MTIMTKHDALKKILELEQYVRDLGSLNIPLESGQKFENGKDNDDGFIVVVKTHWEKDQWQFFGLRQSPFCPYSNFPMTEIQVKEYLTKYHYTIVPGTWKFIKGQA